MELVPIIQRVLTIVAILAGATLLFSYIAFKIRQKKKPEQVYEKNQSEHLEPSFIGKSIRRVTRITKEIIPLNPPSRANQVRKNQIPNEKRIPSKPVKPIQEKKKPEPSNEFAKPRRIEVMNNLSDQNIEPVKKSSRKEMSDKAVNSLGDDILDKYSDSEDQSLFTLKTNKKEN